MQIRTLMYNFILQIIIMASLGTIIYLIARTVPRIENLEESFEKMPIGKLDRLINLIPLDKIDITLSTLTEKMLRKIKLGLMRWDNLMTDHLKKIKKTNGNGHSNEDKPTLFDENKQ